MTPNTPAFPNHPAIHSEFGAAYGQPGMTIRQYAAIQIAAGMVGSEMWSDSVQDALGDDADSFRRHLAKRAARTADVLLAELEKEAK